LKHFQYRALCLVLALLPIPALAQAKPPTGNLKAVLDQLDVASLRFHGATANVSTEFYEAVVKDTTVQTGITYFERTKGGTEMGAVFYAPKTSPTDKPKADKIIQYKDGALRLFDLSVDQIRVMNAGANQAQYESFLTLGFGGSGKDLARSWDITDLGSETITDDGQPVKVEKLDLVGKEQSVRNLFTHITIWVDPQRDVTLRQIFDTPSHDRRTVNNSHIKLTEKIDKAPFAIKPGKSTTVVH